MYKAVFKRLFDFTVAAILMLLLSPVFLLVAFCLWIATGRSPFFTQVRPGKQGKLFRLVKFKSMDDRTDAFGALLSDQERLTAIGRFIRSTSLDEIPQLFNVLKGDMSLVGPRPLLVEYLPLYNKTQARRHEVLPGITGWAQVNGRNAISWEQKFEYDVWYVDHLSLPTDLRILCMTVAKVFKRSDVNADTGLTMERFRGTSS